DEAITAINFLDEGRSGPPGTEIPPLLQECIRQLEEYFAGQRQEFSLPLAPQGTAFQQQVWQYLLTIPFGKTVSYGDVARGIGSEKAVRAVGAANGRNPIPIIIPCHRVVGSNGTLTGYGGGLWRKKWLLEHEIRQTTPQQMTMF
ncbi:MAG: methylated-DNA--[protein]-cysteine S-methyltransferase, partial [Chloroflexi bacterium]